MDSKNKQAEIRIHIPTILGTWFLIKYSTIIDVSDIEIKNIINAEIENSKEIPIYTENLSESRYIFKDNNEVELSIRIKESINNYIGTYAKEKKYLYLAFDEKLSLYEIIQINSNFLILKEDITEKYRLIYPDADIKGVFLIQEMRRRLNY